MQSHGGPADYILFVDGKALGIVEAKKEGTTLSAVAEQSADGSGGPRVAGLLSGWIHKNSRYRPREIGRAHV